MRIPPRLCRIVLPVLVGVLAAWCIDCRGQAASAPASQPATASAPAKLPRLVDLGSVTCIPCKQMAPILEELKKDFAGSLQVEFIDVWKDPKAGKAYGIARIPTQIFFDAGGKELFRHEGFFSRDEILAKFKEFGITLTKAGA